MTPNSRSHFRAGVSLNIHSFIHIYAMYVLIQELLSAYYVQKSPRGHTNSLFFDDPSKLRQTYFIEMRTYFSFGLTLRDIPNSVTPQTPSACYRTRSDCLYSLVPANAGATPPPPPPLHQPTLFSSCPGQRNLCP